VYHENHFEEALELVDQNFALALTGAIFSQESLCGKEMLAKA